jgi:hypothetical protein
MKGRVYIDNVVIGEFDIIIIDESMGVIGGQLITNENYNNYKLSIQKICDLKGISNVTDFNFKVLLSDNIELNPEGGIGVIDMKDFDEIEIQLGGIDLSLINLKK